MSRINTSWTGQVDAGWIKKNCDQMTKHPAWAGDLPESEANQRLEGKEAFTYLLRSAGKEQAYFISFVNEDRAVRHQLFTLELDRKGWYYKNGVVGKRKEIIAEDIEELIPQMMHCNRTECKVLK